MDEAQFAAFKSAITSEFSIIQGPPGTGKTVIGLILMKFLLKNRKLWSEGNELRLLDPFELNRELWRNNWESAPILLICYTNHALDQFLEHLIRMNLVIDKQDLIRVGGRSKSDLVERFMFRFAENVYPGQQRRCYSLQNAITANYEVWEAAHWTIICEDVLLRWNEIHQEFYEALVFSYPYRSTESSIFQWLRDDVQPQAQTVHEQEVTHDNENVNIYEDKDERYGDEDRYLEDGEIDEDKNGRPDSPDERNDENDTDHNHRLNFDIREVNYISLDDETVKSLKKILQNELQNKSELRDIMSTEDADRIMQDIHRGIMTVVDIPYLDRWRLYRLWRRMYLERVIDKIQTGLPEYLQSVQILSEEKAQLTAEALSRCKVLAMTTTGAAKYATAMNIIKPKIVLVEEAAELLEAQVVSAIGKHCQHLIQIGDHQQLRPSTNVYELSRKYKLDISLFERAINAGMHHTTLTTQHRMRPEISELLVPAIYKHLDDHPSVFNRKCIRGVEQNLFFLDHTEQEDSRNESQSYSNRHEAELLARLSVYLIQQGYMPGEITILTGYSGQMFLIRDCLQKVTSHLVHVTTVDNYQGEENTIILLSMVRSNTEGKIGFLSSDNRTCVALSRARDGFFAIGNMSLFKGDKYPTWRSILQKADARRCVGKKLVLSCLNHPNTKTEVRKADDFKQVPGGGCSQPCSFRLKCGHSCQNKCHSEDREHETSNYRWCNKVCNKTCENNHCCKKTCHECTNGCNCRVLMDKTFPVCEHTEKIPCSTPVEAASCSAPCTIELKCNHVCPNKCGDPCVTADTCQVKITTTLACGHTQDVPCCEQGQLSQVRCKSPCKALLPCDHLCAGKCGYCLQSLHSACTHKCGRTLVCQHQCDEPCIKACPPCKRACPMVCTHGLCPKPCGEPCDPCREPCSWECSHYKCSKFCFEQCDREPCDRQCRKSINVDKCDHRQRCVGVCGEPCPEICRKCDKEELENIDNMYSLHDDSSRSPSTYMQLGCSHVFETTWLDSWMESHSQDSSGELTIKQICCPLCRDPVTNISGRHANILKQIQANIDDVKRQLNDGYNYETDMQLKLAKYKLSSKLQEALNHSPRIGFLRNTLRRTLDSVKIKSDAIEVENLINGFAAFLHVTSMETRSRYFGQGTIMDAKVKFGITTDIQRLSTWFETQRRLKTDQANAFKDELNRLHTRLRLANILNSLYERQESTFKTDEDEEMKTLDSGVEEQKVKTESTITELEETLCTLSYGPSRHRQIGDDKLKAADTLLENHKSYLPTAATMGKAELRMVVKAMDFRKQGHWYKCR